MQRLLFLLTIVQLLFSAIAAFYFYRSLRGQGPVKPVGVGESRRELDKLKKLREIRLTTPLAEQTRPKSLEDVIGQENGIKALRAALCSPNPQHVLIYGPPGVGKTAAARLILEEAKAIGSSPFVSQAKFVEIDATTLRFDERSIADPLMGSVHDPIYQGAGAFGSAGIPQPKPGAVTEAHGGILFIDEIGEMHPIQMNKLLKVLEDRVARFQSSYYSKSNASIPEYIHDIFQNGMPADFRLVGATTRSPEDIPPALRSRCTEIYFDALKPDHIVKIVKNSAAMGGFSCPDPLCRQIAEYASNGRDAVNIVQTASSVALLDCRTEISSEDVDWVLEMGRYQPMPVKRIGAAAKVGLVNGLAVYGANHGALLSIEAWAQRAASAGQGVLHVTGIVEEEEMKGRHSTIRRQSNVRASVVNVLTAFESITGISLKDYDLHINFPGGMPVDGPSAGAALFVAVYSAVFVRKVDNHTAMTGEINIWGDILPVGGVRAKIAAAKEAGATRVFIPYQNWQEGYGHMGIEVIKASRVSEVLEALFMEKAESVPGKKEGETGFTAKNGVLTATVQPS